MPGNGIPLDSKTTLYTLQFADVQVTVAPDKGDAEYMLSKIQEEYEKWGLKLNTEKIMYLELGGNNEDVNMETGENIKMAVEIKYLGAKIGRQGLYKVLKLIEQGKKSTGALYSIPWNEKISKRTKMRMYRVMVQSFVLYGADIWQLIWLLATYDEISISNIHVNVELKTLPFFSPTPD